MMKDIIKNVGSAIVGTGVAIVVKELINNNTRTPTGFITRILVSIGSVAIGGFIARKVKTEFKEQVELTFEEVEKINK